jgi:hypothetical protein
MRIVKVPGTLTWLVVAVLAIRAVPAWTTAATADDLTLAIPGRTNATPWVASAGRFVAVVWAASTGKAGDIYAAISRDGGRTFGNPVMVNRLPGDARVSGEIAPRVSLSSARDGDPQIAVTWNAREGGTSIRRARSTDGGKTFGAPVTLQASGAAGDRGWQASAIDGAGGLHTVWLDHREMAASKGTHTEHKGDHDGVAMAQRSSLYYAGPDGAERALLKGVCYCCKTAMAASRDGSIYAAWRHVFEGNLRDIAFTVSRDGGKTFAPLVRVHRDNWSINGCPDDGPAMAVDAKGTVHLVWPTVLNGAEGALHYATSTDGTRFSAPVRVPTLGGPKPSHPQIAIDGSGQPVIAWDEVRDGVRRASLRRVTANGFDQAVTLETSTSSYPVLASAGKGAVAVWTSGPPDRSVIAVRLIE